MEQIQFTSYYNKWTLDYTEDVFKEYQKFLYLRNINSNLSPSDDIDKFWHAHILNTKSYYDYCIKKFGKIIHHNPNDSLDEKARKIRYYNTLIEYTKVFGELKNTKIWNIDKEDENNNQKIEYKKQIFPSYKEYMANKPNIIKIYMFYNKDKIYNKSNFMHDKKIFTMEINKSTTFEQLKNIISKKVNDNAYAVKIYPHPVYQKILDEYSKINAENKKNTTILGGQPTFADDYLNVINKHKYDDCIWKQNDDAFKFFIAEVEEMTSNGFC